MISFAIFVTDHVDTSMERGVKIGVFSHFRACIIESSIISKVLAIQAVVDREVAYLDRLVHFDATLS